MVPRASVSTLVCFSLVVPSGRAQVPCADQVAASHAFDTPEFGRFGERVALSGDTAVIGAVGADGAEALAGAAYLFEWSAGAWAPGQKLIASDGAALDQFSAGVAISGNVIVIGAIGADGAEPGAGAAYVYELIAGHWVETAKLAPLDGRGLDGAGASVAVNGDRIALGSPFAAGVQPNAGCAYLFERVAGAWIQVARLAADDGASMDEFGISAALDSATLIVGAWRNGEIAQEAGAAYVFENVNGIWIETGKLTAPDGAAFDRFGYAVDLSGSRVVAGAYLHGGQAPGAGAAYVFEEQESGWTLTAKLTGFEPPDAFDRFGVSVAAGGNRIVVGANGEDRDGEDSGAAYVFEQLDGAWTPIAKLAAEDIAPGSLFGSSVAVEGETVLTGSPYDSHEGLDAGTAQFFEVGPSVVITRQPSGFRVVLGQPAEVLSSGAGHGPLSFQWTKGESELLDGGNVSGATTPTLKIDPVTRSDSGPYRLTVRNLDCSATSNAANVTVIGEPGDLDVDGDVDIADSAIFAACLIGPNEDVPAECQRVDIQEDNDVDLKDFHELQAAFGGADSRADFNFDGVVDLDDYLVFTPCMNGPRRPMLSGCREADFDPDDDVDLTDFGAFAELFPPPDGPASDLDGDGDVDLDDAIALTGCMTGPGGGVPQDCGPADIDEDGDIDLADFAQITDLLQPGDSAWRAR